MSLWFFVFGVPPIILFFGGRFFQRVGFWRIFIAAVVFFWFLLGEAVGAYWDWRVADAIARHASDKEMQAATADGANMVFTAFFGWMPAFLYCCLWMFFLNLTVLKKSPLREPPKQINSW